VELVGKSNDELFTSTEFAILEIIVNHGHPLFSQTGCRSDAVTRRPAKYAVHPAGIAQASNFHLGRTKGTRLPDQLIQGKIGIHRLWHQRERRISHRVAGAAARIRHSRL